MDYVLGKGEVLSVAVAGTASALSVRKGQVWLTCSDDPADYLLSPDDRFTFGAEGTIVLEALTDATIAIEGMQQQAARASIRLELTLARNSVLEAG